MKHLTAMVCLECGAFFASEQDECCCEACKGKFRSLSVMCDKVFAGPEKKISLMSLVDENLERSGGDGNGT